MDEKLKINTDGKVSSNLVEKVTDSCKKAEQVINTITNTLISNEKIRKIVLKIVNKITNKEKEEIKLYEKNQLIAVLKEITALFEETDELWINLQGKDRQKRIENNTQQAPEGIQYRNLGKQERQIFSKLKKRFCSGRKAFGIHEANTLSKVCVK